MWIQKIPAGVRSLTFSADGQLLYVLDARGRITAWNPTTRTPRPFLALAPSRIGTKLATACDGRFLVTQFPALAQIWDTATGAEHAQLPVEPNGFTPSLDPTRRLLVAPDAQREVLTTWDIATRKPGPPLLRADPTTADRFGPFALTADGHTVAVRTARREIVLYDRREGRAFVRFDEPVRATAGPARLAFSPDGNTLALMGLDWVARYDVPSRALRADRMSCTLPEQISAVHPTLPVLAALNAGWHVTLFSLETGEPIRTLDFTVGKSTVLCICFSPDGLTCAVGGSNKQFAVFDVDV